MEHIEEEKDSPAPSATEQKDDSHEAPGPQGSGELTVFREEWREELKLKHQQKQDQPSTTNVEEEVGQQYLVYLR